MSQVFELFDDFKRKFVRNGYADPQAYLSKLDGTERVQLGGLIDAYLDRAPARQSDEASYRESVAAEIADSLDQVIGRPGGMLPMVLPRLRKRAKLHRSDLATRLATELGLEGKDDRVAEAYHELETGQLDAVRVKPPVIEALARILGESTESLYGYSRRLGSAASAPRSSGVAFARRAYGGKMPPETMPARSRDEWDDVDELFRGGGGGDD